MDDAEGQGGNECLPRSRCNMLSFTHARSPAMTGRRYWRVSQILQCIGEREDVRCVVNRTTARRHTQSLIARAAAIGTAPHAATFTLAFTLSRCAFRGGSRRSAGRPSAVRSCPSPVRSHTARSRYGPHSLVRLGSSSAMRVRGGRSRGASSGAGCAAVCSLWSHGLLVRAILRIPARRFNGAGLWPGKRPFFVGSPR